MRKNERERAKKKKTSEKEQEKANKKEEKIFSRLPEREVKSNTGNAII